MVRWKITRTITFTMKNIWYTVRRCYHICRCRVISIFAIACITGVNAANTAFFYRNAIGVFGRTDPYCSLFVVVAIYLTIHLTAISITNYLMHVKFPIWDMRIRNIFSKELYQSYSTVEFQHTNVSAFYDSYTRALQESNDRPILVLNSFQYFLSNLLSVIGILSVIASLEPLLILFAVVPVFTSTLINMLITKERYQYEILQTKDLRKIEYIRRLFTLPEYKEQIRVENYTPLFMRKYSEAVHELNQLTIQKMPSITKKSVLGANLFSLLNYAVPALYLGWRTIGGFLSEGEFSSMLIATTNMSTSLFYASILLPQLNEHAMHMKIIREFLDNQKNTDETPRVDVEKKINHSIRVEDVSFTYSGRETEAIRHVSLCINAGEKIAFVGKNGAGKSTLVKIILHLIRPQTGEIFIDDIPYSSVNVQSLRENIAVVFQEHRAFAFSIGENILCDEILSEEDEERVLRAVDKSGLAPKTDTFQEKIHTVLTSEFDEGGVSLSGGEAQKLAIARVICKDAGIVILDEPSSSLDPEAEYELYARMSETFKDKTIILISHRLYSTKMVDRIYYLEDGAIAENGSHEALMKLNGKYAKLYNAQASRYQ